MNPRAPVLLGRLGRFTVLTLLLASGGCALIPSHVHDSANAEAARQARDAMIEYGKNSPKLYSAMLVNVDRFKLEEEYLLSELTSNLSDSLVTKAPSMTWKDLSERTIKDLGTLASLKTCLGTNAEAVFAKDQRTRQDLKNLDERVVAARREVQSAKTDVSNWNASIALLREAVQQLPVADKALSGKTASKSIEDLIKTVGAKEIEYVDADGKTVKETVSRVVRERIPDLLETLKDPGSDEALLRVLPDAPGLDLAIANLGLELAQVEQRRAQIHLERNAAASEVLDDALVQLAVAEKLLVPVSSWVNEKAKADGRSNAFQEIWRTRLQARAKMPASNVTPSTADFQPVLAAIGGASLSLANLRDVVVAESILARVSSTTPVALERLEHTRSITESQINDSQYQALIRSGLVGLAAYHDGGLTSEDIANLIRFVQAVAVGVLAGMVP